ncbi:rCG58767, partial [Rattus norvegicus]
MAFSSFSNACVVTPPSLIMANHFKIPVVCYQHGLKEWSYLTFGAGIMYFCAIKNKKNFDFL